MEKDECACGLRVGSLAGGEAALRTHSEWVCVG